MEAGSSEDPSARSQAEVTRGQLLQWDPPRLHEAMQTAWSGLTRQPAWQMFRTTVGPARLPLFTVTGSSNPNAETYAHDDGSVLIAITDGMIRFVRNACTALFSSAAFVASGGTVTEGAALDRLEADALLKQTYLQWAELKTGTMAEPLAQPLDAQAEEFVEAHFRLALLFIGLHEYGHAMKHSGLPDSAEIELEADRWAFNMLLDVDSRPPCAQGYVFAGAIVAMRVFAALDIMGIFDLAHYPTPNARLANLRTEYQKRFSDPISCYLASQPGDVLDLRMNAIEAQLVRAPSRKDQLIAQIVAHFHAVHLKRQTLDVARTYLDGEFAKSWIRREDIKGLAATIFSQEQESYQIAADDPDARAVIDMARDYLGLEGW